MRKFFLGCRDRALRDRDYLIRPMGQVVTPKEYYNFKRKIMTQFKRLERRRIGYRRNSDSYEHLQPSD